MEANDAIENAGDEGNAAPPQNPPAPTPGEQDRSRSAGQAAGTFGARVKNGVVTAQGIVSGKSRLSAADKAALRAAAAGRPASTRSISTSLHGDYRLTAIPGHDHDVLITGLPLADVEATLRKVEIASSRSSAAPCCSPGSSAACFVGLSLRPLRRVAATATRVTELPLASGEVSLPERVPDADPRTEVGQVGAAFNRMLGHVEAALTRRAASEARLRRFAADASHELRTPLAAIRGYAELARRHRRPGPRGHRARAGPGRIGVGADERARGRAPAAGPARCRPAAGLRAGRPDPAGHRRRQRRPGGHPRSPVAARAPGRAGHGPRRRAPAAPGAGQPDEQRGAATPRRGRRSQ